MNKLKCRAKYKVGVLVLLLIVIVSKVAARPPDMPTLFNHSAPGLRETNRPGYHLFTFSVERDTLLKLDSLENIRVEITSIDLLRMVSDTLFIFKADAKEPYTFPLSIVIPDNDSCEILLTFHSGEKFETLAYTFISKYGRTECVNADLMNLRRRYFPLPNQITDSVKKASDSTKKN